MGENDDIESITDEDSDVDNLGQGLFSTIDITNIGDAFQQLLKYHREDLYSSKYNKSLLFTRPKSYKEYPKAPEIDLIPPEKIELEAKYSLLEILKKRHSSRSYNEQEITLEALSFLVWAATGIRERTKYFAFRTAPSAGALYPIETYLAVNKVSLLSPGLYHYNIKKHSLELLKKSKGIVRRIAHASLDQIWMAEASVIFIFTAIVDRSKIKYGQRAYRYIYLDLGHIAENLALAYTSIDLKGCHVAAFFDDEINRILDIDGLAETVLYLTAIGT